MRKIIKAVYENGVFKPLEDVSFLDQNQRVKVIINGELSAFNLAKLAEKSGSFDFLKKQEEDIYSLGDGQAV
ncbi:MAG: antitoxin family protein [Planctomycetes bacterium]|nr:antitoxin family protein [Planctomycetota bacterium]